MFKRVLVLTFCLLFSVSAVIFAKGKRSNSLIAEQSTILDDTCYAKEIIPDYPYYNRIIPEPEVFFPLSNDTIGYTYYDYQFNAPQHRQIANDSSGTLHFTWMDLVGPSIYSNRYMDYNARYADGTWLISGGMHVTAAEERAGYGGLDILQDNKEVLCYHQTQPTAPAGSEWGTAISIEDSLPGTGQFNHFDVPDSVKGAAEKGEWPAIACSKVKNGDTTFIHITHEAGATGCKLDKELGYVRCFEKPTNGDTLVCQSPGWVSSLLVPKDTKIVPNKIPFMYAIARVGSGAIATSPVSQKVCIAWLQNTASSSNRNEVRYLESTSNGNDWMAAGNMGTPIQLTNYGASGYIDMAYPDIAAVYDYNDILHIVWTTYRYNSETFGHNDVTLWHWSPLTGIRKVSHTTEPADVDAGAWNLIIAKFTLGVEYMPGDSAYNYLYLNYTKFKEGDVSASGFANGDIYVIASSNGGLTWGPEINLTNANSNGCTAGNCQSENWSSVAERVDSFLYVQYIYDLDAGGIPNGEGTYTYNPVRFLKYPRFLVEPVATLSLIPTQMVDPVRWAKNNGTTPDSLTVSNENGTATLYVKVSGPSWLNISPDNFSITEGGLPQKVNLTFNGGGFADTFLVDSLRILSNNGTSGEVYSDTDWVKVHFVVTDSFYYPEFVQVNNGAMVTKVSNVGNLGHQDDSSGMFYNGHNFLYDFSPVICINIPGYGDKSAAWIHNQRDLLPESHLQVTDWPGLRTTSIKSSFAPINPTLPQPYHWFWSWYTIEEKNLFFWKPIKPPSNPVHYERAILKYNRLYKNLPPPWWSYITPEPPTLPDAYLGFLADFDVPAQAYLRNKGGYDQARNLIWITSDSSGFENYYGACLFFYATKDNDTSWAPFGAYVLFDTSEMYIPPGYPYDTLCRYLSLPGWGVSMDSATDMSILVSGIELQNVAPATVVTMKYALMITDQGKADLDTLANQFRRAKCGDVSSDGKVTVSDIVFLVNYLFKGGPEPWLYYCDANGDCQVTVSDVVCLVNYLFKGGAQVKCDCGT